MALLAKQAFKMFPPKSSPWMSLITGKHKPASFAPLPSKYSWTWRALWNSVHFLRGNLRFLIDNGQRTSIRHDSWLYPNPSCHILPLVYDTSVINDSKVSLLINHDNSTWNWIMIRTLIPSIFWQFFHNLPSPNVSHEDTLIWILSSRQLYSQVRL